MIDPWRHIGDVTGGDRLAVAARRCQIHVRHLLQRVGRIEPEQIGPWFPFLHAAAQHPFVSLQLTGLFAARAVEPADRHQKAHRSGIETAHAHLRDGPLMGEPRIGLGVETEQPRHEADDCQRRAENQMPTRPHCAAAQQMSDPGTQQREPRDRNQQRRRPENPVQQIAPMQARTACDRSAP